MISEKFARYMGTPYFLIGMTVFVVAWLLWNTLAPEGLRFDPYAFIFLTLILSLQASYAAPLILLAQNRQADRDRVALEQDRSRDERNLADTEFLTREVAALRIALRDQATRDFVRGELRDLLDELEERGLVLVRREDLGPTDEPSARPRPRTGAPARRPRLGPCPRSAPTPSTPRSRRSSTPRSASPSPSSAWSRASPPTRPATSRSPSCSPSAACPLKDTLTKDTTAALAAVEGVTGVTVTLGVMSDEQRGELKTKLRGGVAEREVPFARAGSLTRVYAVASGKGGVGKSSVTANLAASLAAAGAAGRRRRRRHLRLLDPPHARRHRPAHPGRRHDPAAAQPRREGHLDRHVRTRQPAGRLARADAAPRPAAVPRRRVLGRPRRAPARPAAGHRRHRHLDRPADPERRDPGRHHPAGRRRRGRRAGRRDRAADPPAGRRRHREHELARAARRHPPGHLRLRRRPAGRRLADPGDRRRRAAARPDPARHPAADRRRPGDAGRARRARLPRRRRAARHRQGARARAPAASPAARSA